MEDCADENQLLDQAADGGKYKSYGKANVSDSNENFCL
jgi:hypothetical protein